MVNTIENAEIDAATIKAVLVAGNDVIGAPVYNGRPMISVRVVTRERIDGGTFDTIKITICGGLPIKATRARKAADALIAHAASLTDLHCEVS